MCKKFLGGVAIGLGCMAYVSVENKYIGALLFSIGLLTICARKWELFTGKLCSDFTYSDILLTWIFNALGIITVALMYMIVGTNTNSCRTILLNKASNPPGNIFISGMLCELCIYIAVTGYRTISSDIARVLSLVLGVMVFILCGFEHCIADMFYACYGGYSGILLVLFATCGNIFGACALKILEK